MGIIRTVTGDISPSDLGLTSMHDHTVIKTSDLAGILVKSLPDISKGSTAIEGGADIGREMNHRKTLNIEIPQQSMSGLISSFSLPRSNPARKLSKIEYYTNELKYFYEAGGRSLCDCSPISIKMGAHTDWVYDISKNSGVNIISCVGYYVRPSISKRELKKGESFMESRLSRYMEEGDGKSPARPGFVKCAISYLKGTEICPEEWTAVTVGARVAKKYGCSFHIHTAFPLRYNHIITMAQHLINDVGIDPSKVIFCHTDSVSLGDSNPIAHITESGYDITLAETLLNMGYNIGLDTWCVNGEMNDNNFAIRTRYAFLCELLSKGYAEQITLGHDMMAPTRGIQNRGGGYTFLPNYLKEKAAEERLIADNYEQLFVKNPARILEIN